MNRIYRLSNKAIENQMSWDKALYENEIVTVKEFDCYEKALEAFENGDFELNFDIDYYGVE